MIDFNGKQETSQQIQAKSLIWKQKVKGKTDLKSEPKPLANFDLINSVIITIYEKSSREN